ncbi:MAG: hypothetical protein WCS77_00070 [Elusimicrobiaceae bacterium]
MAIEKVKDFYGAKFLIPYSRTTGLPFGVFRVLQEINFERKVDFKDLTGGDAQGAWDTELGQPENSLSVKLKEYPNFVFSLFEGNTPTENAAEAAGYIGTPTNKVGTSVIKATTGIASIAVKSAKIANLPAGRLLLKATAANKIRIYLLGLPKGDAAFQNIGGEIASAEITIPSSSGTVDVDDLGLTITAGSGTVAFTADDTAYVDVRPVNSGSMSVDVGGVTATMSEFGAMVVFPQKSDGAIFYIDIFRVKAFGVPWSAKMREWSEWTLNGKVLVDTANSDKLYRLCQTYPNA